MTAIRVLSTLAVMGAMRQLAARYQAETRHCDRRPIFPRRSHCWNACAAGRPPISPS